ncbi:hypothetical protein GALMADRAFT_122689 [Galerina marginata CBS 339.88]|uniref:cAMP-independent regulatory protein pac2 n=1 Tax=Galerina marginata (strain CBS 339.88) TaxID=685588 RepID=A0A067SYF8_GALM3|nr:hypothetical protein GALMADRAFT_122689 [Galerina marginata CBS 339.88]
MQQPTCTNVRIRSTADAHKIFAAVQQGMLHMVTRRLDADERIALRSGCVYAWEERGPHSELTGLGIERFTEGRRWSPSRVRDEFLFYYEKYSPPPDANNLGNTPERQPPRDWDPLVKQTYSVWVQTEKGRRKWHLTAYFTQATIDQLGSIDDNALVRDLLVPDGMFKSTRVGKSRNKTDDSNRSDAARAATTVPRTYAPFPTPYQYQAQSGSPSMTPVLMHEPYQTSRQPEQLQSPVYEQSPSPVSPQSQVAYVSNHGPYSSLSSSSPSYMDQGYSMSPTSVPQPVPLPSHGSRSYTIPSMRVADDQSHFSSRGSPSSWDNPTTLYQRPRYYPNEHARSASPYASASSYISADNPSAMSPHAYNSPMPTPQASNNNGNNLYSPSYSLHSALTLPPPTADSRAYALSPLQIPDRLPSQSSSYTHPQSFHMQPSPNSDLAMEEDDMSHEASLAPLDILRRPRPVMFRRDPSDEKTLRLLREKRTTS